MAPQGDSRSGVGMLRFLAGHRMAMYLGGLLAILSPTLLERSGTALSPTARTLVILASLALMLATYVGERRFGKGRAAGSGTAADVTNPDTVSSATYSRRTRIIFVLAVAGFAVGVYVAIEVSRLAGIVFVVGAYLFGYFAFEGGGDGN